MPKTEESNRKKKCLWPVVIMEDWRVHGYRQVIGDEANRVYGLGSSHTGIMAHDP